MTAPTQLTADTRIDGNPMLIVHGDDDERNLQDITADKFLSKPARRQSSALENDPFISHTPRVDGHVSVDPFLAHLPEMQSPEPNDVAGDPFMLNVRPLRAGRDLNQIDTDPFLAASTAIPATVSIDPFLTRVLRNKVDGGDPFLRNVGNKRNLRVLEDVKADPFLANPPPLAELRQGTSRFRCMRKFEIGCIRSRWKCARNCGAVEGSMDRACTTFGAQLEGVGPDVILTPWVYYMATVLTWIIGGHYFPLTSIFITYAFGFYFAMNAVFWCRTSWTPHPDEEWTVLRRRVNFETCCLLGVVCGVIVGHLIWHDSLRQVWWMATGVEYSNTTAVTPAAARGDASWIHFEDAPFSTSVDTSRSAGFRQGAHIYCAAPVLSNEALGGGDAASTRVSYWAVGMDCCQSGGSFTCDAARDRQGAYGVVMLDHGFPCAGCNVEHLEAAVSKAEAMHDLVSSPHALYMRWVRDPGDIRTEASRWAFMLTAFSFFVALWVFIAIAWALDRSETFVLDRFMVKRFQGRVLTD